MYRLCYQILGPAHGDFRPGERSRDEFSAFVQQTAQPALPPTVLQVVAPRAAFTNKVVDCKRASEIEPEAVWFRRSVEPADGALIEGPGKAVAFFNGDCPLVCLWQDDRLAALHAGYRCLIREDHAERNLLDAALESFAPQQVHAWIGFGIGPCCWIPGYATKPEILDPDLHAEGEAIRASRRLTTDSSSGGAGHVTIDLAHLARVLLLRAGVPAGNIRADGRCTCCWRENGRPVCWSLTRAKILGEQDGRNFAAAWLESE